MILLKKKVAGLGLVVVGGLVTAHGGAAGAAWEVGLGLLLVAVGVALLAAKVVRRNIPHTGPAEHRRPRPL
jgi:hypothetical protein